MAGRPPTAGSAIHLRVVDRVRMLRRLWNLSQDVIAAEMRARGHLFSRQSVALIEGVGRTVTLDELNDLTLVLRKLAPESLRPEELTPMLLVSDPDEWLKWLNTPTISAEWLASLGVL